MRVRVRSGARSVPVCGGCRSSGSNVVLPRPTRDRPCCIVDEARMKIALIAPAGVSNHALHTIPALMWLVGRLATRHTVKVYLLHRAAASTRVNVLGAEVVNDGGSLRHL